MKQIANLLFEVRILKDIIRSGYAFLGAGKESIAEHSFMTAFICFAMAKLDPDINSEKLVAMALVHDLAEARTGDLNYVEKQYSTPDEAKAVSHLIRNLSFGNDGGVAYSTNAGNAAVSVPTFADHVKDYITSQFYGGDLSAVSGAKDGWLLAGFG